MASHWCDFQNTDVILNCGSNSVENHPVSALWLEKAHEQGAKWIVVDPRYTRTAEQADIWCPIRSGTDIAFYGGMYNYIIEHLIVCVCTQIAGSIQASVNAHRFGALN